MTYLELLQNISVITIFCMGVGVFTREGMVLYFLHYPFIDGEFGVMPVTAWIKRRMFKRKMEQRDVELSNATKVMDGLQKELGCKYPTEEEGFKLNEADKLIKSIKGKRQEYYESTAKNWNWLKLIATPIVRCPVCFASVWGSVIFWGYNGLQSGLIFEWIFCCVGAAFLNALCWGLYERT